MRRLLSLLAGLALAAPSPAHAAVVSRPGWPTPIRSERGWSAWLELRGGDVGVVVRDPRGHLTRRPERVRTGDELHSEDRPLPFDLGPDARGRPTLAYAGCDARACGVRIARLPDGGSRWVAGTRTARRPVAVSLWRDAVAWSTADRQVHLRPGPGAPPTTLDPWPRTAWCAPDAHDGTSGCDLRLAAVDGLELHDDLLASSATFTGGAGFGPSQIGLLNAGTGHRTTYDAANAGLNGQEVTAPAFLDARTLGWLYRCVGEPDACREAGPRRVDLRTQDRTDARISPNPTGWAPAPDGQALLGRSTIYDGDGPIETARPAYATVPAARP